MEIIRIKLPEAESLRERLLKMQKDEWLFHLKDDLYDELKQNGYTSEDLELFSNIKFVIVDMPMNSEYWKNPTDIICDSKESFEVII